MYIPLNEGRLYYEITDGDNLDDGRPILFFIPGGPGLEHSIYKTSFIELTKNFHIVYHDPRGCGRSSKYDLETCNISQNVADIEFLRRHLGFSTIHMMGFSYGSMVALGYAVQHSHNIERLILLAGASSYRFIAKAKQNVARIGNPQQIRVCELLWRGEINHASQMDEFFQVMAPLYSITTNVSDKVQTKVNCALDVMNIAFKKDFWKFDYTKQLSNITCNTLVLCGKYDWINDPSFAKEINDQIPSSSLIEFNSGHSMQKDVHDELVSEILSFCFPTR